MQISTLRESELVKLTDGGKRLTSWWLSYIVFLVFGLGVLTIGVGALMSVVMPTKEGSFGSHATEAVMFALQFIFVALWLKLFEGRSFSSVGFSGKGAIPKFGVGILIGAGMNLLVAAILVVLGGYTFNGSAPDPGAGLSLVALVVLSLVIVIIQASGEELWFRGFLLQRSARALPGIVALLLPAIVFWLSHGVFDPFGAINIVLFAVFAGLIALRQGSLFLVAGIHTGWNFFMGNIIGAPVSGLAPREATLFILAPKDGAAGFLTGSGLGLEGTIACTVVWAIGVAIAFMYFRSGSKAAA